VRNGENVQIPALETRMSIREKVDMAVSTIYVGVEDERDWLKWVECGI
jgi:hypothetical protein